jgi:hypothetical protein
MMKDGSIHREWRIIMDAEDLTFDEEAAIEAAQERSAVSHLRDVLKGDHGDQRALARG